MTEHDSASHAASDARSRELRAFWGVLLVGFVSRLLVVVWAAPRFPPAFDGSFYHVVAARIAQGHGYTWLWPDGVVTYAAHYPVGYPALIGVAYAVFGPHAGVAMALNLVIGCLAVWAAYAATVRLASRRTALVAGFVVALHPSFVFYTPALMTEGVSASLLVIAVWPAVLARTSRQVRRRWLWTMAVGGVLGLCALVRPQVLLLTPLYGWLAVSSDGRSVGEGSGSSARWTRWLCGVAVPLIAVTICLPWTARNCQRMDRCVFVSANAGWNLLIGAAPEARGSWLPLEDVGVPVACREVFEEASKDACFRTAAVDRMRREPMAWLALAPMKLRATFDFPMAAAHYLHASNPLSFPSSLSNGLISLETLVHRLVSLGLAVATLRAPGPRRRLRWALGSVACVLCLTPWGAYALLTAVLNGVLLGYRQLAIRPLLSLSLGAVLLTALTHILFFGAGRYGLVVSGLCALAAASALGPRPEPHEAHT